MKYLVTGSHFDALLAACFQKGLGFRRNLHERISTQRWRSARVALTSHALNASGTVSRMYIEQFAEMLSKGVGFYCGLP